MGDHIEAHGYITAERCRGRHPRGTPEAGWKGRTIGAETRPVRFQCCWGGSIDTARRMRQLVRRRITGAGQRHHHASEDDPQAHREGEAISMGPSHPQTFRRQQV